jgi:hypothetical protein
LELLLGLQLGLLSELLLRLLLLQWVWVRAGFFCCWI